MVKKHIAPGGFPFAENAILEGLEGDEYMRRTIEEIQQSTAKMRAKRESSMAHEIAKIRMRQDAVAARRGPPPRPQYPRYEPFSGVRKQPGGAKQPGPLLTPSASAVALSAGSRPTETSRATRGRKIDLTGAGGRASRAAVGAMAEDIWEDLYSSVREL